MTLEGLWQKSPPITYVNHYSAHLGNAYYLSPFEDCAFLSWMEEVKSILVCLEIKDSKNRNTRRKSFSTLFRTSMAPSPSFLVLGKTQMSGKSWRWALTHGITTPIMKR